MTLAKLAIKLKYHLGEVDMPHNDLNDIRRSAAITMNGPGAIVDARAGRAAVSGVHVGLEAWDSEAPLRGELEHQRIYERRLLSKLRKKYFRLPPVVSSKKNPRLPQQGAALLLRRFPNWLQCPTCSIIKQANRWSRDPGEAYLYCATCSADKPGKELQFVTPVRLVAACVKGHLDDFPWSWWIRSKCTCEKKTGDLKLYSQGMGLGSFSLKCINCNQERSMESAFNKTALAGLNCSGSRPWLDSDEPGCDCSGASGDYRALQRGASNLYYPIFESALDIPPWTEPIQDLLNDRWDDLLHIPSREDRIKWISNTHSLMEAARHAGLTAEEIADAFESMQDQAQLSGESDFRLDEFRILNGTVPFRHNEFEAYPSRPEGQLGKHLMTLTKVSRLREVRVLKGFTRIKPPQEGVEIGIAQLSNSALDWLPAFEIRGEGIFISLKNELLASWAAQENVRARTELIESNYREDVLKRYPDIHEVPRLTPQKILIHTLSHLIMSQLTLECGYSSASLRERLYLDDNNINVNGILIYTGTADSDGTLGGLQARAEQILFERTIQGAIQSSSWCASDPICIEGHMAPLEMHSGASCHSCLLAPETSCEFYNKFLDRALLIGLPDDTSLGFFDGDLNG
jgi:hypothetical protein